MTVTRIKHLGHKPLFQFYYQGGGVYRVFAQTTGGAQFFLGEIMTTAPVAFSHNPGKWIPLPGENKVDSMHAAALTLLAAMREKADAA